MELNYHIESDLILDQRLAGEILEHERANFCNFTGPSPYNLRSYRVLYDRLVGSSWLAAHG